MEAVQSDTEPEEIPAESAESDQSDDAILEIARRRFDLAAEAERAIRIEALEDLEFAAGKQWDDSIRAARELDRRPCLTINRIPQSIRQVTNDLRQNRPSIKVSPVDDKADIETGKILQGVIRHIEYSSDADTAYDTAGDSSVRAGFGYFRVVTEYCDPMSFELDIRIKRIRNRFSVYLDPHCQEPDGSDANWGFVFEDISRDDFKAQYPNAKFSSMEDWKSLGDDRPEWVTEDTCRVAEYFYKEFKETPIYLIVNGATGEKATVTDEELPEALASGMQVIGERKTILTVIHHCKINAVEILEKTIWPGIYIPIIPVLGDEQDINGRRTLEGIVRHAKDPQRMYNYWSSSATETISLAPRAPFIGAVGQFKGLESIWETANVRNHAYLEYNPISNLGQPIQPPQRNAFEPAIQAITMAMRESAEDIKSTTGIYDASLGAKSNENSGIAIQRRNHQSQTSNFHFADNLSKSIRHCGRILVDLIPKIYDTERAIRILGEDGAEEIVHINRVFERNGKQVRYDLGVGKYDVTVDTGPSYETKRQEAVAVMSELTRAYPQIMQVAGDLFVKNMDLPGASDIAERLKKTLPPGIADDKDQKNQPLPPQVKAQMDQMGQMIEQLTEQLKHKTHQIDTKAIEIESKERIEMQKLQVELQIAMAQMDAKDSLAVFQSEIAQIENRLNILNQNAPIQTEMEPEAGPEMAAPPQEQPPTGGLSPGQPMEQMP